MLDPYRLPPRPQGARNKQNTFFSKEEHVRTAKEEVTKTKFLRPPNISGSFIVGPELLPSFSAWDLEGGWFLDGNDLVHDASQLSLASASDISGPHGGEQNYILQVTIESAEAFSTIYWPNLDDALDDFVVYIDDNIVLTRILKNRPEEPIAAFGLRSAGPVRYSSVSLREIDAINIAPAIENGLWDSFPPNSLSVASLPGPQPLVGLRLAENPERVGQSTISVAMQRATLYDVAYNVSGGTDRPTRLRHGNFDSDRQLANGDSLGDFTNVYRSPETDEQLVHYLIRGSSATAGSALTNYIMIKESFQEFDSLLDLSQPVFSERDDKWVQASFGPIMIRRPINSPSNFARGGWSFESILNAEYRVTWDIEELPGFTVSGGHWMSVNETSEFLNPGDIFASGSNPALSDGERVFTGTGGTLWVGPRFVVEDDQGVMINKLIVERIE